ncbi:hypothetical protein ACC760_40215, partial [Rhizobium ruizarguesonis]
ARVDGRRSILFVAALPFRMGCEQRRHIHDIDRIIADNIAICGSHFPFPGSGTFVKEGSAYGFTPTIQA